MKRLLSAIILAIAGACIAYASGNNGAAEAADTTVSPLRPLTAFYGIEIGGARDFNTYLSPIRQTGTHAGIQASWSRATGFAPEKVIMDFDARFAMDFCRNKQHTSSMTGIDFALAWDMLYRLRPLPGLQLAGGGGIELDAGALYLPRNSNNPVAARLSLALTLNLRADYSFHLGRLPITITDRFSLPSLGVFFSPEYGESYYEIYLGDHSGLANCGWWGNHFQVSNLLLAQFTLGNIRLCAGYRVECRSSYANKINTRLVNHSFVLGIATDWLNVTRGLKSSQPIIPAAY